MERIVIPANVDRPLRQHLDGRGEQLAFLGAKVDSDALSVASMLAIGPDLLDAQDPWHVALTDAGRVAVFRWAHNANLAVIEVHTHGNAWPACLSPTDIDGLVRWVPHVMWRLPGRPYAAVVVAGDTIDALIWPGLGLKPQTATAIERADRLYIPTGHSLTALSGTAD